MSQRNVETLRRGYEMWNEGDMEAMLELFSPDFEFVASGLVPGLRPVYHGHQGWLDFWRDYRETFESLRIDLEQARDLDDVVVALITHRARGRDGVEVERRFGNVWTFTQDGLIARLQGYADWSGALEAAGLSE